MRLDREKAVLIVIDVQERLMPAIDGAEGITRNLERLVRGAHLLGVPVILTEQYVKGLGPTVAPLRHALEETAGYRPIEKSCFSAYGCAPFTEQLGALGRRQAIVAGVETHVCVYQTALDLAASGAEVTIVADAAGSRTAENKEIALRRLVAEGVKLSSTEMVLFEMTVASGTDEFRAISKLVK